MKISLNWLTDYVDVALPAAELGDVFTHMGLNCDGIAQTDSDVVFVLDVTSNRPDWLGHLGVARELSAALGLAFRPPAVVPLTTAGRAAELTSVEVREPALCPRYVARVIRNVTVKPSPAWLVERLAAVGMRSVNNIVDITNFVLMEYSQPLHAFDYDKLHERRIVVRRAAAGEILTAINGDKCELHPDMLVIADASRPVAIAGVMGGLESEVSAVTTNLLLEAAQFDPLTIRRTSRKLQLMSESNYRFERGVDPRGLEAASLRACELILQYAGGELADGSVDVWAKPVDPWPVAIRPARTRAVLGMDVPVDRHMDILARLGLAPRVEGDRILCTVPTSRADLTREIDLIEEVARLHGFDKIPVGGSVTHTVKPELQSVRTRRELGRLMSACGFDETITPAFVDAGENEWFFEDGASIAVAPLVRKTNNVLRATLLGSLLRCAKLNDDAGNGDLSLYEVASVFAGRPGSTLPAEHSELAMLTTRNLRDLRGAIETVVAHLTRESLEIRPEDFRGFAPGGAARLYIAGQQAGAIGVVADDALQFYGLEKPLCAARIDWQAVARGAGQVRIYQPLPKFPAVRRDLSLIVDEAVTWQQFEQTVHAVAQPLRSATEYVTTYRGKPIPDGKKSVTITLTYRSDDATLRGEQVDDQVQQVTTALTENLGAEVRK
ncbi:MAG: phenylalanine--tRNA ligase subunit beta [Phycisphaerae bacterium]|nr:phenylalanine--tRNA ligase subunit beta [Phycisphaerae bacterium]